MSRYAAETEAEHDATIEHGGHDLVNGHGNGHGMDRFPTEEELFAIRERSGLPQRPEFDPEEIGLRFDRHVAALTFGQVATVVGSKSWLRDANARVFTFKPWLIKLILAMANRRVDHRTLTDEQRKRFNDALKAAHADGSYQAIAAVHTQNHMMHSTMGAAGTQRFLPWHRIYLLQMAKLLNQKVPGVTIPYWDYANDHSRPDWVWQPPGVSRNTPGVIGSLPSQTTIDGLVNTPAGASYTTFTSGLESNAHNGVHNWCNGTITNPSTAAQDPIFWLLHAGADRIWDTWQVNHSGTPSLAGSDATMDPWSQTAADADDIIDLGYTYY